ncbi:uncharacterized protein LOC126654941 [Mercurialis annua]|uniref:uncharacterized protein LOC126654941 n=1 Tax=Mercurialis annua TaxID=3986 RepID=UPI00215F0F21|nr:uncharacterized protein LOC126654941 [Mercurialis annua]
MLLNFICSAMAEKEEEREVELELGLSIGGSYRRKNDSVCDETSTKQNGSCVRSSFLMEEMTKKEMHALRRREVKKKREEKQQLKKIRSSGQNINVNDNGMWLMGKDNHFSSDERECKKMKTNLSVEQNGTVGSVIPLQYGLPAADGFVYPCGNGNVNVVPCWLTPRGEDGNVVPVVGYGFVPFQAGSVIPGYNGYDSEQNGNGGSVDGGDSTKGGSNRSPFCGYSTGSDHRSSSNEGGGSSDTRSRSSPSIPQLSPQNILIENDTKPPSDHSATSHLTNSGPSEKTISSCNDRSSPAEPKEEAKSVIESENQTTSTPLMESKGDMGKPPEPQPQNHAAPPLPFMPCVSTTGNGPNGKTVNGFLYRYTKSEVSIICVCHGSSFSPAEFVQHAGGTDVSHPLKHITVIPSAF